MMGALDCVQHFQLILKAMNAKKVLEVGCFTGSTALSFALALPDDGKVITTDITDKFVFQDIWKEAGVDHKVW
jgi:predicted O-methyltransferase YrrM